MSNVKLTYRVALPDSRERVFDLQLDRDTAQLTSPTDPDPPEWTELPFHQCTGCPLDAAKTKHCPAALHLAGVIDGFADLVSYDTVRVTVETEDVDALHQRACALGVEIVYALRDEPWGQRHFMAKDPNGLLVDVVQLIPPEASFLREHGLHG